MPMADDVKESLKHVTVKRGENTPANWLLAQTEK